MSKLLGAILLLTGLSLVGCSTDENPVTPEKMQDFRKQEEQGRANFNPSMTPPATK